MKLTSFDSVMKDYYPLPGTRIKQYVVDGRREAAWERDTCPQAHMAWHDDNTGATCRNSCSDVAWVDFNHDCCADCDLYFTTLATTPEVMAWLAEKAKRPPICADHEKLSDEIEPDRSLALNPMFNFLKR